MINELLKDKHIILASGSPRRQQFLKDLNIDFEIRTKEIDENYPNHLKGTEITDYLAKFKANAFLDELKNNDILITSDTIVWLNKKALGKPKDFEEAKNILLQLSGKMHKVITSIAISDNKHQTIVNDITKVYFKELTIPQIEYYIKKFKPYDKAGSYGIQEWIGFIGIDKIEGSYFNVMGFPTHKFYEALINF